MSLTSRDEFSDKISSSGYNSNISNLQQFSLSSQYFFYIGHLSDTLYGHLVAFVLFQDEFWSVNLFVETEG